MNNNDSPQTFLASWRNKRSRLIYDMWSLGTGASNSARVGAKTRSPLGLELKRGRRMGIQFREEELKGREGARFYRQKPQ